MLAISMALKAPRFSFLDPSFAPTGYGQLVTESGDYLITEDGDYLATRGTRYFMTEALDSLTTESSIFLTLE